MLPASRLEPRLAAIVAPITMLAVWETDVTAVEGGRYLTTWEPAVLGLPAKLVVTPASTDTLHTQQTHFIEFLVVAKQSLGPTSDVKTCT